MLIAESGRVHLHGVVTRDVVHVNSGVREVLLVGEGQCMETYGVSSNTELPVWTPVCK